MTIRIMDMSRQRELPGHLCQAEALDADEVSSIMNLAAQLEGVEILPVVGAGASFDCGVRVAPEIAGDLLTAYRANDAYAPHDSNLTEGDLAEIAEAIWVKADQKQVVRDLGFPDPDAWRPAEDMGDHFCVYCVLARMVREEIVAETVGFNYDCGAEAGLEAEGFQYGDITPGLRWKDHARIVADATANAELKPDGAFKLYKAHGCAGRYREVAPVNEAAAADSIVVRTSQLHNWQGADWIRDPFRDRARNHILLLVGFSGQDPKVTSELRDVLEDVYRAHPVDGTPRIVAIDRDPQTTALESLVKSGLGEGEPSEGNVTQVCTDGSTATAAMLVLLTEMLAIRLRVALEEQNVALPTGLDERLGTLVVSAPTMIRWSFLVRRPGSDEWMQRANLMAQRGYVPLNENRAMSARVIGARQEIRRRLGRDDPESSKEALENHGFLVDAGRALALMPVGVSHEQLLATCHQGVELENMRRMLPHPKRLECILVSGDGAELRGVSLAKGKEVDLDWVD